MRCKYSKRRIKKYIENNSEDGIVKYEYIDAHYIEYLSELTLLIRKKSVVSDCKKLLEKVFIKIPLVLLFRQDCMS